MCVCFFLYFLSHFFYFSRRLIISREAAVPFLRRGGMLGTSSRTTFSRQACMHPILRRTHLLSPFLTFCSVGLGSYLRAHILHTYPGPLSCRSYLISSSCLSLPQCSRFVRLGLCLSVSQINVVPPNCSCCPSLSLENMPSSFSYSTNVVPNSL